MGSVKGTFGKNSIHVRMAGQGSDLNGLPGVKSVTSFPNYAELRLLPEANTQQVLASLIQRGGVMHFEVVEPSLYDIFIETAKSAAVDTSALGGMTGVSRA